MRGFGMSFMDKLVNVLGNVVMRINNLRYIMVIKNVFVVLILVIIMGVFGMLFLVMVFDLENGLVQISFLCFLEELKFIVFVISYVILSFLIIYVVFLIGIELVKLNKVDGVFFGIIVVMFYLFVNLIVYELVNENQIVIVENVLVK